MATAKTGRWRLGRDALVFQLKLFVDGIKDILLSPVSMSAALIGLLVGGKQPARLFHRVLWHGKRAERWINLFGELPTRHRRSAERTDAGLDQMISQVENTLLEHYQSGSISSSAKEDLQKPLAKLHEVLRGKRKD